MPARAPVKVVGVLAFVLASLWPLAIAPGVACAGEAPRAALVVDTGGDVLSYCVTLPDDSVSGMELIELASEQHGLGYKLGFGGGAVCMLAGVGPTSSDCFEEDPDFWGYWRGDGSGGWVWSGTGATGTSVGNGDVEGWAWGSGTGPDTHPAPPEVKFVAVCAPQEPPLEDRPDESPPPEEPEPAAPEEPVASEAAEPQPKPRPSRDRPKAQRERPKRDREYVADAGPPSPTPRSTPAEPPAASMELASDGGPPVAGVVALVATAGLGAAGVIVGRRRRGAP